MVGPLARMAILTPRRPTLALRLVCARGIRYGDCYVDRRVHCTIPTIYEACVYGTLFRSKDTTIGTTNNSLTSQDENIVNGIKAEALAVEEGIKVEPKHIVHFS